MFLCSIETLNFMIFLCQNNFNFSLISAHNYAGKNFRLKKGKTFKCIWNFEALILYFWIGKVLKNRPKCVDLIFAIFFEWNEFVIHFLRQDFDYFLFVTLYIGSSIWSGFVLRLFLLMCVIKIIWTYRMHSKCIRSWANRMRYDRSVWLLFYWNCHNQFFFLKFKCLCVKVNLEHRIHVSLRCYSCQWNYAHLFVVRN